MTAPTVERGFKLRRLELAVAIVTRNIHAGIAEADDVGTNDISLRNVSTELQLHRERVAEAKNCNSQYGDKVGPFPEVYRFAGVAAME